MSNLYLLEIENGMEHEDYDTDYKLIVAKDIFEANREAKYFMDQNYEEDLKYGWVPEFRATLINEIDGYKITVEKMEDEK